MSMPGFNIVTLFLNAAQQYPDRLAIVDKSASIKYQKLESEVLETAAYFRAKGISPGDRVLVFVPMSIDLYRSVLALFMLGATAVFLDEWVSKKRLNLCCKLAECKGFIGNSKANFLSHFSSELRRIPIKLKLSGRLIKDVFPTEPNESEAALITFTTGSTGIPKAALRTHQFLQHQFEALLEEVDPKPTDVAMPVLPIVLFMNLGVGACSIIPDFSMRKPDQMNTAKIFKTIQTQKVNRITASPFFIDQLAKSANLTSEKFPNLSKIITGGAPVFEQQAKNYQTAFPGIKITVAYGSTEAEPISTIDSNELIQQSKKVSLGLPVGKISDCIDLRIIQISTQSILLENEKQLNDLTLPPEEIGEIIVSGKHVLKAYYKNDAAFKRNKIKIENKIWHRTGDSGFVSHGHLFLTGRCQQLISHEGKLISPFVIEEKLSNIEGIKIGTLIKKDKALTLVVESTLPESIILSRLPEIPFERLIILPNIPKDPRHQSKIDYAALDQQIVIKQF